MTDTTKFPKLIFDKTNREERDELLSQFPDEVIRETSQKVTDILEMSWYRIRDPEAHKDIVADALRYWDEVSQQTAEQKTLILRRALAITITSSEWLAVDEDVFFPPRILFVDSKWREYKIPWKTFKYQWITYKKYIVESLKYVGFSRVNIISLEWKRSGWVEFETSHLEEEIPWIIENLHNKE